MKKLLLITFLFLITPDAKADMDYVCEVTHENAWSYIPNNCVRNNILYFDQIDKTFLMTHIAFWCRQDREINYQYKYDYDGQSLYDLTCVLYDNKPRKQITPK